jgi:hypothetical protein
MKRKMKKLMVLIPIGILAVTLFGFIVMSLWNWLVPAMFGGKLITFWQALGVLVLSRLLFGGFSRHGGRKRWRVVDNWNQLTPEEQEKFRAGMRHRCGGRPPQEEGSAPA